MTFFVYQISSQGEHNICWRKYLDKVLVQRMRPWHAQAPSLLNCYAENQVKNLLCFWKGLGWMIEKGKQREKSESFCELTFLHDPTYLPRSLLKFTKCEFLVKTHEGRSSGKALMKEKQKQQAQNMSQGRDSYEVRSHCEWIETWIRTLDFIDLRNWEVEFFWGERGITSWSWNNPQREFSIEERGLLNTNCQPWQFMLKGRVTTA